MKSKTQLSEENIDLTPSQYIELVRLKKKIEEENKVIVKERENKLFWKSMDLQCVVVENIRPKKIEIVK